MIPTVTGITYGDLDQALKRLGFEEHHNETARTYRHIGTGALIPFPLISLHEPVRAYHLGGARATVDTYGITASEDFDLLLLRISQADEPAPAS